MTDEVEILIEADEATITRLEEIAATHHLEAVSSQRRNFDGSVPTWVFLASVTIPILPELIRAIRGDRKSRVRVDDVEIEGSRSQIEEWLARFVVDRDNHAK